MKNVVLVITGSVSARLFFKLQTALEKNFNVKVLFTESACALLKEELLSFFGCKNENEIQSPHAKKLFGKGVLSDDKYPCFSLDKSGIVGEVETYQCSGQVPHVELVNWADKLVVSPCSANTLNKMANGIADGFVMSFLTAFIGTDKPMYVAPAMNTNMYRNFATQKSIKLLRENRGAIFISPTVKKLECGDFGIGALADVDTISNIVGGSVWRSPILRNDLNRIEKDCSLYDYLPTFNEPGSFGFKRTFEIHNGLDVYCRDESNVFAVEDGGVIKIEQFTGKDVESPWWEETWAIYVKGQSGVVCYGEMNKQFNFVVGDGVRAGDSLGCIRHVLPESKIRRDIRNHNNAMLHIQLFSEYFTEDIPFEVKSGVKNTLLDPTPYMQNASF